VLLKYTLALTTPGDADLFVNLGSPPTEDRYLASNTSMEVESDITMEVDIPGRYFVGVLGFWSETDDEYIGFDIILDSLEDTCDTTTKCSGHGECINATTCRCTTGYSGHDCETKDSPLKLGEEVSGYVADSNWNYYTFVGEAVNEVTVSVNLEDYRGDVDLYIKGGSRPTLTSYDYSELAASSEFNITIPYPFNVEWHIGIYGWLSATYTLKVADRTEQWCGHGTWDEDVSGCLCDEGWAGDDCNIESTDLENGVAVNGSVAFNDWMYYVIEVEEAHSIQIRLLESTPETAINGTIWLYVAVEEFPDLHNYDKSDISINDNVHSIHFVSRDEAYSGYYYIGVYGSPYGRMTGNNDFSLVAWYTRL